MTEKIPGPDKGRDTHRLSDLKLFSDMEMQKLSELSVVTTAQFIGLATADERGLAKYLGLPVKELLDRKRKLLASLPWELVVELTREDDGDFPLGALPPRVE